MSTEMLHLDMAMNLDPGRQIDPDVQATLSDFLTYSEHLPSTIARSLFLIESLNYKASELQLEIHNLLSTYSNLPQITATTTDAPDPVQLRKDISHAYDSLEKCKRMSTAEAIRLEETVVKDGAKLQIVQKKLKALPLPPERDATPDPGLTSPQLRRNAQAQQQADKRTAQHRTGNAPRVRAHKIMVPGEVLPPPNPDSPPPSDFSPSPSPPPRSPGHDKSRNNKAPGRPPKTPKLPKPAAEPKDTTQKPPRIRLPGSSGTNAHSAVAGISTSNALMALTAPPPDAAPGSKWLPWKRLTEYEMATLRKRMKKNAIWLPSPAMRNRELKNLGRGVTAMEEAKAAAEASGQEFLDEFDPLAWSDPTCIHITDAQQAETAKMLGPELPDDNQDAALINRGMRLNEAKKLKREKLKAEEAAVKLQEEGSLQPPPEQNKEKKSPQKAQPKSKSQVQPSKQAVLSQVQSEPPVAPATEQLEVVQPPVVEQAVPVSEPKSKAEPKQKKHAKPKPAPMPVPEIVQPEETSIVTASPQLEPVSTSLAAPETAKKAEPVASTEPVTTRKRKRDATTPAAVPPLVELVAESPDVLSLPRPGPQPKKLKLSVAAPPPADTPTITISHRAITAAKDTSSPSSASTPAAPSPRISARQQTQRSQRNSAQPEPPLAPTEAAAQTPATNTRAAKPATITLKHSATKAASAEPANRRQSLRRNSNASLPGAANNKVHSPVPVNMASASDTNSGKRPTRKKPPQGVLQAEGNGTKVIVGKPKGPSKKKKPPQQKETKEETATPVVEFEDLDPDEPRYCICGDVSHGTMIACDNESCELEWFHLGCVGLTELPKRRTKWYCPICRKKLNVGLDSNGIV
ncbi:hypothetical protein E4T39_05562 [Aureobasidium subglaciale]|nr:hypothetical protein E4T39_05562 [Aureobasidium subglaciale]